MNTSEERMNAFYAIAALMKMESASVKMRMGEWKLRVSMGSEFVMVEVSVSVLGRFGRTHRPSRQKNFTARDGIAIDYTRPCGAVYNWLEQATEELKQERLDLLEVSDP